MVKGKHKLYGESRGDKEELGGTIGGIGGKKKDLGW